ncbi:MAG: histidine--tRNA ligase [Thermotogota bacterium]
MINRPKGTNDIYGEEIEYWQSFEKAARKVAGVFGFQEIRTPIFEMAELFIRSVGDETDIVQKEMYTFEDKAHRLLCLRPEGTAPVVRSFIENNMASDGLPKQVYYMGPMFRYERPQAGRQRQFHQFGAELIGSSSPLADAEMIWMSIFLLEELRLHRYTLQVNMLGCQNDREAYKAALKEHYRDKLDAICPDCRRRYETNALRLLDCKVEGCQAIKEGAPILTDFLCPECQNHKRQVSQILAQYNIDATWNPRLVRGLDYYTGIVFEVKYPFKETVFDLLGGGRYDQVIEQLGGSATPSVGFACGIERMVATMREEKAIEEPASLCQVFVLSIGEEAKRESLKITDFLRKRGISVQHDLMGRNIRNQLKYADKQRALYTIIIGEDELDKGVYLVKEMDTGDQIEVDSFWVENYILEKLAAV